MLFNSIDFAVFLPIVFLLYWFVFSKKLKSQNFFIVIASYIFYGWWDWRFLSLIVLSTLVDYTVCNRLASQENKAKRKVLLWTSITVNIGMLGFFKYYNFFLDNLNTAFSLFGSQINLSSLDIILPVGISFYTFQTLSYTIDVYRKKLQPTNDIFAFAAFVGFFPQLVAGPIERATRLLPQFYKKRNFEYTLASNGMRQILWGLFKKIVIADNCAEYANMIFNNSAEYSGGVLFLGALFFTFQIYGDFSGYSDIAIGTAKLFGLRLSKNFSYPYFSRDIGEFWRRWHISLSTWFRDYLYIPLGGSRVKTWSKIRNVIVIFSVSGFWHGANWTFVIWGALNAVYFIPILLMGKNRENLNTASENQFLPSFIEFLKISITFLQILIAWIFFRAENLNHAYSYLFGMFEGSLFNFLEFLDLHKRAALTIGLIVLCLGIEWFSRNKEYVFQVLPANKVLRWIIYLVTSLIIFGYGNFDKTEFIYFAF